MPRHQSEREQRARGRDRGRHVPRTGPRPAPESRSSGGSQARIVAQDPALQLVQRRRWLKPELLNEPTACGRELLERFGVAARPVKGQHQARQEPFAQRVLAHQPLELGHELGPASHRQIRLDPGLQPAQPEFLQAPGVDAGVRVVRNVRPRRTPPQSQRRAQRASGRGVVAGLGSVTRLLDQLLEPVGVELLRLDVDRVAAAASCDSLRTQQLAQAVNICVERDVRARRGPPIPDRLDQSVTGDGLARV